MLGNFGIDQGFESGVLSVQFLAWGDAAHGFASTGLTAVGPPGGILGLGGIRVQPLLAGSDCSDLDPCGEEA
jgi:hypothetical protein